MEIAAARTVSSVSLHVEVAKALHARIASMMALSLEKTQTMTIEVFDSGSHNILIVVSIQIATIWRNILMGENIDEFDEFYSNSSILSLSKFSISYTHSYSYL